MLKIRLKRVGRRNDPSFRVVVVDSRRGPKSNKFVEQVGFYNPKTKERDIKKDRVLYWIGLGAQPSDTVHNMLIDTKTIEGKKINVLPQKSPVTKEKQEDSSTGTDDDQKEQEAKEETDDKQEVKPEQIQDTEQEEKNKTESVIPSKNTGKEESKTPENKDIEDSLRK